MKKSVFILLGLTLGAICLSSIINQDIGFAHASNDEIAIVNAPRFGQDANFKVATYYSSIRVQWDNVETNNKHVRVIARANTDEGSDVIDLSSYDRIEFLVKEGTNHEFFSPFLIDSDGDMFFFGTSNSNAYVAGSAWFNGAEIGCPNTQLDPITLGGLTNCDYSGVPAYKAEGKEDFVYYHFSLSLKSEKAYTDWKEGLGLTPTSSFDFSKVKACGFNMCKQSGNNQYDWDFGVVAIYGRKQTDNQHLTERTELFNAAQGVITASNSTMWNDGRDANDCAYVYVRNNADPGKCNVTVEHNLVAYTKSVDMPVNNLCTSTTVFLSDVKASESAWLWAFAPSYEISGAMNLTGYDGWSMYIKNNSNYDMPIEFYQLDSSRKQWISGSYHLYSAVEGTYTNENKVIPANFEGYVYSLFESYGEDFVANLSNVINETRVVLVNAENFADATWTISSWSYKKNVKVINDAKSEAISLFNNVLLDDYRETEKLQVAALLETAFVDICKAATEQEIKTVTDQLAAIKTDAQYKAEALGDEIAAANKEFEDYITALKQTNNYLSEQISELDDILSDGKADIATSIDMEMIAAKLAFWKVKADQVLTASEVAEQELIDIKQDAVDEINSFDTSSYRSEEAGIIASLQQTAVEAVNAATSENEVNAALEHFYEEVAKLKNDAQLTEEEIAQNKDEARETLNSHYLELTNQNVYREAEATQLSNILSKALADIDAADNHADILLIVSSAQSSMDDVKTDAQYRAEEIALAIANAKQAATNYVNSLDLSLYSQNGKEAIQNILAGTLAEMDAATSEAELSGIYDQMISDIADVQTASQENAPAQINWATIIVIASISACALVALLITVLLILKKRHRKQLL